jgi:hypothetical protein
VAHATPDLVVVGHICRDVVAEPPGWRPGGAVFYAAATAARLGYSVGVVTAGAREVEALRALPNTAVVSLDARKSTSFENVYDTSGSRRQYLRALAQPIPSDMVPSEWRSAPAALLAPVASEVSMATLRMFPRALVGVSPQGWMRELAVGQEVRFKPWDRAQDTLGQVATAIFSEDDVRGHQAWLSFCGPVLVTTRGALGCDLFHCGSKRHVAGFPSEELDPTGAGDVFAAAYMLKLRETREPLEAARFANCVASFSVSGRGIESLPTLDQVQDRMSAWKSS